MSALKAILFLLITLFPSAALSETYLLMAEESGCFWCARWNKEISHIYPKTAEGRAAPLRRYDLHNETPNVKFASRVHYTPTFILITDNVEIGRIEGYPGEDFFWGLLAQMLENAGIPLKKTG